MIVTKKYIYKHTIQGPKNKKTKTEPHDIKINKISHITKINHKKHKPWGAYSETSPGHCSYWKHDRASSKSHAIEASSRCSPLHQREDSSSPQPGDRSTAEDSPISSSHPPYLQFQTPTIPIGDSDFGIENSITYSWPKQNSLSQPLRISLPKPRLWESTTTALQPPNPSKLGKIQLWEYLHNINIHANIYMVYHNFIVWLLRGGNECPLQNCRKTWKRLCLFNFLTLILPFG